MFPSPHQQVSNDAAAAAEATIANTDGPMNGPADRSYQSIGEVLGRLQSSHPRPVGLPLPPTLRGMPGTLTLLVGAGGVGKTMLGLQLVRAQPGEHVAIAALQSSKEALLLRMLAAEAGVDSRDLRRSLEYLAGWERLAVQEARERLALDDLVISAPYLPALDAVLADTHALAARRSIDILFIDDLIGLIARDRPSDLAESAVALRDLARALSCRVLTTYPVPEPLPDDPNAPLWSTPHWVAVSAPAARVLGLTRLTDHGLMPHEARVRVRDLKATSNPPVDGILHLHLGTGQCLDWQPALAR